MHKSETNSAAASGMKILRGPEGWCQKLPGTECRCWLLLLLRLPPDAGELLFFCLNLTLDFRPAYCPVCEVANIEAKQFAMRDVQALFRVIQQPNLESLGHGHLEFGIARGNTLAQQPQTPQESALHKKSTVQDSRVKHINE